MTTYTATTATDAVAGTDEADTIVVTSTHQIQSSDLFDGSGGSDTLQIGDDTTPDASADLTAAGTGFHDIEVLAFYGSGTATLSAAQFGAGLISASLAVTGAAGTQSVTITNAATFSAAGWTFTGWTRGVDVLAITGTGGGDIITGSAEADTISGGGGDDELFGGARDRLYGEDGDDTLTLVTAATDTSGTLSGGDGDDTLLVSGLGRDVNLDGGSGDDHLTTDTTGTLDGGAGDDTLTVAITRTDFVSTPGKDRIAVTGGAGNDIFDLDAASGFIIADGGDGDDTLSIVERPAAAILRGGAGNDRITGGSFDTLLGEDGNDVIVSNSAAGSLSYLDGGSGDDDLTGGDGDDTLAGGAGADTLAGGAGTDHLDGGSGADRMAGGAGDDVYIVDDAGDEVVELAGEGTDTVRSAIDSALGANVEALDLTGAADINGTGNALDNTLNGNAGANALDGGAGNDKLYGNGGNDRLLGGLGDDFLDGSTGADRMAGGSGDDVYVVDAIGDEVVELAGEGTDSVRSAIDYMLGANVETLALTGTANINGAGNELANTLNGNAGANTLDGGAGNDKIWGNGGNDTLIGGAGDDYLDGGSGADQMRGGAGDDIYIVDAVGDVVVESAGDGVDTVRSAIDYTLGANVESLALAGTGNTNGTGNAQANTLSGNSGANTLDGGAGNDKIWGNGGNDTLIGGGGDDLLFGGTGADTFVFRAGFGSDKVCDFEAADFIDLSDFGFNDQADALAAFHQVGADTVLDTGGGDRLVLTYVTLANLHLDQLLV